MRKMRAVDGLAMGLLLAGTAGSLFASTKKRGLSERINDRQPADQKIFLGLLAAGTSYKLIRAIGPKSKEERRLEKVALLYDQAESYRKRAQLIQRLADTFLRRRFKSFRTAISS